MDQAFEFVVGQIVGEVEVGQVIAGDLLATRPHIRGLLAERVGEPLSALGLYGLVAHLGLEVLRRDDAPIEQLLAHAFPDAAGQDRILAQLEIESEDLGKRAAIGAAHAAPRGSMNHQPGGATAGGIKR